MLAKGQVDHSSLICKVIGFLFHTAECLYQEAEVIAPQVGEDFSLFTQ